MNHIQVLKDNNNATVIVTNAGVDYRYLLTGCLASAEEIKAAFEKSLNVQPAKRALALRAQGLNFAGYYEEI